MLELVLPILAAIDLFHGAMVHFNADSAAIYADPGTNTLDSGRLIEAEALLPAREGQRRIYARVAFHPVPKDEQTMHDRWDRAANLRLVLPGKPDLEVARLMTSYGGTTTHEIDVTDLAPLLAGECRFRAFVDTWVSPAWRLDVSVEVQPDSTADNPTWVEPIFYTDSFNQSEMPDGATVDVVVPGGLRRVVLRYLSTGHCTDGRDEDEFVSKANVIRIDGHVVVRVHPWRDDCRQFRDRNPYCRRWADGTWSSDYSRSGWCPGDVVDPMVFDVSDHLPQGRHTIRFQIEGMRPKDPEGNFGYWRVSAALVGWDHEPQLWRNR